MKRIISVSLIFLLTLSLFSCGKSNLPLYEGHDSSPYMTALARGKYYLEMSMLYGGAIVSNTLAAKNGNFESISEIQNIYTETGAPGEKRASAMPPIFWTRKTKVIFLPVPSGTTGFQPVSIMRQRSIPHREATLCLRAVHSRMMNIPFKARTAPFIPCGCT